MTLSFRVRVGYSVIKDSISRDFPEDVEQLEQDDERLRRFDANQDEGQERRRCSFLSVDGKRNFILLLEQARWKTKISSREQEASFIYTQSVRIGVMRCREKEAARIRMKMVPFNNNNTITYPILTGTWLILSLISLHSLSPCGIMIGTTKHGMLLETQSLHACHTMFLMPLSSWCIYVHQECISFSFTVKEWALRWE